MSSSFSELQSELLRLNNSENPFLIKFDGNKAIITWNIVDAKWIELIGKAGIKEAYRLTITFDEASHSVKYVEETGSLEWEAGVPHMSFDASYFRGKKFEMHREIAFGMKDDLTLGKLYDIDFNTSRVTDAVFPIIEQAGWKIKGRMDLLLKKLPNIVFPIVIVICAVVGIMLFTAAGNARVVIDQQLAALKSGDISTAYSYTSSDFQEGRSLEQFKEYVGSNPILTTETGANFNSTSFEGNFATLQGKLNSPEGKTISVIYFLTKEGKVWKIAKIKIFP